MKVLVSHGAGKDECVKDALDYLVPLLEGRGYEVFVDMTKLRGSDRWSDELYYELYKCDAAVVLLGPKTIESSEWVRRESDILMSRHSMKSLHHVLPILLGGATSRDARGNGFGPLMTLQAAIEDRVQGVNPIPSADAPIRVIIDWAMQEFAHIGVVTRCPDVQRWAERIADYLDQAAKNATKSVERAAGILGMDEIRLAQIKARVGSDLLLAYELMAAAKRGPLLSQALGELQPALDGRSLESLIQQLLPGWVEDTAAKCFLPDKSSEGFAGRIIFFPAKGMWMASHHVQRALFARPGSWSLRELADEDDLPSDDRPLVEVLMEACVQELYTVFLAHDDRSQGLDGLIGITPSEGVKDYLVVSLADYPAEIIVEVATELQRYFPWLNFILLAPPDHEDAIKEIEVFNLANLVNVEPAPTPVSQMAAYRLKKSTDQLLKSCS
ncbi:toll/interleukin-1 receptor domain-containing protein [Streptomyces tauricus]|uniref:toll/interleukin-1 receptor domain-containing protein n=1 Tax=Streptomyces tauricus TaxID=68274 RepID=UPI0033AC5518